MNKLIAILLALVFTFSIWSITNIPSTSLSPDRELVVISKVTDGDTVKLQDDRVVRLVNINAPEKINPASKLATDYMKNFLEKDIEMVSQGTEKYGRTLGKLYSGVYINLELVKQGLASKFLVNPDELQAFYNAEESAISNHLGIWRQSFYSDCISTSVDSKKEIATLENSCNSLDITNWTLKDESRKQYIFSGTLEDKLYLHSSDGNDDSENLYWNQPTPVWNDDRDTLYLFDSQGNLVSHYSYGYV